MKTKIIFFSSVLLLVFTGCRKWIPKPFKKIKTFTISGTLYLRCDGPTMANVKLELWPQPFHKSKEIFYTTTDANGNFTFHCSDEKSFFTNEYYITSERGPLIKNLSPIDTSLIIYQNIPNAILDLILIKSSSQINDTIYYSFSDANDFYKDRYEKKFLSDTVSNYGLINSIHSHIDIENYLGNSYSLVWGVGRQEYLNNLSIANDRLKQNLPVDTNFSYIYNYKACDKKTIRIYAN